MFFQWDFDELYRFFIASYSLNVGLGVFSGFLPVENLLFMTDEAKICSLVRLWNCLDTFKTLNSEGALIIFADFNYV